MSQFLTELRKVFGSGTNRISEIGTGATDIPGMFFTVGSENSIPAEVYGISFQVIAASADKNFILRDGTATGDTSFTDIFQFNMTAAGTFNFDYQLHPLRFERGIALTYSAAGADYISMVNWAVLGPPRLPT